MFTEGHIQEIFIAVLFITAKERRNYLSLNLKKSISKLGYIHVQLYSGITLC